MADLEAALLARRGRRSGDEISFCCPAHDDTHPSASFNLEKGVGTCHACGAKWNTVALRRLLGLPPIASPVGRSREITYDYRTEDGTLVYQTVRIEPGPTGRKKRFFQRRPNPLGGWINNTNGVRRVVYRLPELVAADPKAPVFVVEGEKDVDRLRAVGLVGTCNVGGADNWRSDDSEALAGRHVFVIPDNDDAGRRHADKVIEAVRPVAATVLRIDLPDLPLKGDVSDWLDAGGTAEKLLALVTSVASEATNAGSETGGAWQQKILRNAAGGMLKVGANVEAVLTHHPEWAGKIAFDEFAGAIVLLQKPPDGPENDRDVHPRPWRDDDAIRAAHWFQRRFRVDITESMVASAVEITARRRTIHPVRAYLRSLAWDGVGRLDTLLQTYAGADTSEFVSKAGARCMVQAVARVMEPGCPADSTLILEGPQGSGKSTFVRLLCPNQAWFADEVADLESKDAAIGLSGKWFIELSELDAFRGKPGSRIKAFLSRRVDHYRAPYARIAMSHPRQSVFIGTTNSRQYLHDETGARRFWPIRSGQIDLAAVDRDRDQIWAEAVARYDARERWWFEREELPAAEAAQTERYVRDEWETLIEAFLEDKDRTTVIELMENALRLLPRDQSQGHQKRVVRCLTRIGWIRCRASQIDEKGRRGWFYRRPDPAPGPGDAPIRPTPSQSAEVTGTAESSTGTRVVPLSQSVPLESEEFYGGEEQQPEHPYPTLYAEESSPESGTKWDTGTPVAGQGEPPSHSVPSSHSATASHLDEVLL